MDIDVIIPVYNAHKTLDRCLSSIAMQTIRDNITVNLVSDHPEETYQDIVSRYSSVLKIRELRMPRRLGLGAVRQYGVDCTGSPFFCFVDADDTLASSFALEHLLADITSTSAAVSVGCFQEVDAVGTFTPHARDMIWVFGKLHRRSFWEQFDIQFHPTSSANEDTGVLAIIAMLAKPGEISYIDETVYLWHYNDTSITKAENCRYTYDQNITGYAENMVYAINHVKRVSPGNPRISERVMYDICNLYKMHVEAAERAPHYLDKSWEASRMFYAACFPQDGIPFGLLIDAYDKVMYGDEFPMRGIIPYITLMDFIRKLAETQPL